MPYVVCTRCDLRTYSAALWASTEVCPRCGVELPRAPGVVISLSDHPRFRGADWQQQRAPEATHE